RPRSRRAGSRGRRTRLLSALAIQLGMDETRVRLRGLADARARAIDEVRLDRDDPPVLHRAYRGPARPRRDLLGLRRIRRRREGAAVAAGRAPDEDRGARDLADGLWIDDEHEQARRRELLDRAVGELHDEDEIGLERDDLLEVHLDAADLLDRLRRCRLVG